jgi:hypothetical protein
MRLPPPYDWSGWWRRLAVTIVVTVTLALSAMSVVRSPWSDLGTAFGVFGISLAGFSLLALLTFKNKVAWRAVDYPWVCSAFMAVMVALSSLSDAEFKTQLEAERLNYMQALAGLRAFVHSYRAFACEVSEQGFQRELLCFNMQNTLEEIESEIINAGQVKYNDSFPPGGWPVYALRNSSE